MSIEPHGGELVNCLVDATHRAGMQAELAGMPTLELPEREQCDIEMLAIGAFSPLRGFMGSEDFHSVCDRMALTGGEPWGVPITCSVDAATSEKLEVGQSVCLTDAKARPLAVLRLKEKYPHDKDKEADKVYLTRDARHPGVAVLQQQGDVCLAGPVEVLCANHEPEFGDYRRPPAETRRIFAEKGWQTVVAFQTRNPIHRAHEYLTRCALETCDGLMIHPLVGQTQAGDIPADVRMRCYEVLIQNYYNPQHVLLSVMPSAMRYAGPREAILHAVVRKNYGCTHFIVGRDHAGVGDYYGTYDAQKIFDQIDPQKLGIVPLKFEHAAYCKLCGGMASRKTCGHDPKANHVFLSGTKVRAMLAEGECPPPEFTRPEVAKVLVDAMHK